MCINYNAIAFNIVKNQIVCCRLTDNLNVVVFVILNVFLKLFYFKNEYLKI